MVKAPQLRLSALAIALSASLPALSQTPPDAGQTLQQLKPSAPVLPKESVPLKIETPAPTVTLPGGQQVSLKSVAFVGNSVITTEVLTSALGDLSGQQFDLSGLRALASKITEYYRRAGYPFARAFLPPQPSDNGVLLIEIVEGRYGQVSAMSEDEQLANQAQPWLGALALGAVIESKSLERATLIMDDLPGVRTAPVIRPGAALGTGDLVVGVSKDKPYDMSLGIENHGNRYTGYNRLRASATLNSPFMLGDQVSFTALGSDKDLWLGSVNYSAPLGFTGLRAQVGLAHTAYELAREFADTQAEGTADVASAGLTYPLIRSQKTNLTISGTWQYKRLKDDDLNGSQRKHSNIVPIALQFDHRDSLGAGGVTFGSVSWTRGNLNRSADDDNLNTRGGFSKVNIDIARLQALPENFSLYGRVSAQQSNKNLDSSEDMSLAGSGGVRAYPVGELSGDEGWLGQLELRYAYGVYAPYLFYDHGRIRANEDGSGPSRTLAGGGVGLRYQRGGWNADLALAWRSEGGRPADANERDNEPRLWASVGYRF